MATIVAAVGGIAYLSIFRAAGTNTALLVFGTLTVTLVLLAAARLIVGTVISKRVQLVRLATLGRLSAQMGHDLKNPLAALKGAAQFLREERAQGRRSTTRTSSSTYVEQIARLTGWSTVPAAGPGGAGAHARRLNELVEDCSRCRTSPTRTTSR